MAHIHTLPGQHDTTVGAYIVRLDGTEPKVLLHMHRKLNALLPIGGHVELTESPWQAIAHELCEESGYSLAELTLLQPRQRLERLSDVVLHPYPVAMNTHDYSPSHFHSDTAYAFVTQSGPKAAVQVGESSDLRWLSRAELNALAEPDIFANTKEIYNFVLDACLPDWERVATADYQL